MWIDCSIPADSAHRPISASELYRYLQVRDTRFDAVADVVNEITNGLLHVGLSATTKGAISRITQRDTNETEG